MQLRGIRLLELPPALAGLPRLHSLRLSFDPQARLGRACLLAGGAAPRCLRHDTYMMMPTHISHLAHACPQMPGLLFPTPAALVRGLPPSLRCLALEHPPLPGDAALELAGKLPRLRSFCLAWQPDWEVAYL